MVLNACIRFKRMSELLDHRCGYPDGRLLLAHNCKTVPECSLRIEMLGQQQPDSLVLFPRLGLPPMICFPLFPLSYSSSTSMAPSLLV